MLWKRPASGKAAGLTFNDTGLESGSQYSYTVASLSSTGAESLPSASVVGKTSGDPPPIQVRCVCALCVSIRFVGGRGFSWLLSS